MPGILPNSGSEVAMGKVYTAYTNATYPTADGTNVSLSGTLGSFISVSSGTQISLSTTFGGRSTPYPYP
jgi:hypothetical protein